MNQRRLRIVVCDVDAETLIDLEHVLEDAGFNTTTTWDTADLAQLLEEGLFRLLIIGDHPPQMDAEDVLKEVRAQDRSEPKVLCLISPRKLHKSEVERLRSAGATRSFPTRLRLNCRAGRTLLGTAEVRGLKSQNRRFFGSACPRLWA